MTTSGQAVRPMMRAVEYDRSCGPQEPEIRTVARPQPGHRRGARPRPRHERQPDRCVDPVRWHEDHVGPQLPKWTCWDFTGEVVAPGGGVTDLTHGQRVWGSSPTCPAVSGAQPSTSP